jgi:hypothetical protein
MRDNTQAAKETSKQITVYFKATNYSSKTTKIPMAEKVEVKYSIHAMKIYGGVKV